MNNLLKGLAASVVFSTAANAAEANDYPNVICTLNTDKSVARLYYKERNPYLKGEQTPYKVSEKSGKLERVRDFSENMEIFFNEYRNHPKPVAPDHVKVGVTGTYTSSTMMFTNDAGAVPKYKSGFEVDITGWNKDGTAIGVCKEISENDADIRVSAPIVKEPGPDSKIRLIEPGMRPD